MKMPTLVPELGYYYHYKHRPDGAVNTYAYEFLGVGFHTENDEHFVNYRPLYEEAAVYQASKKLGVPAIDNRPLLMWMGDVEVNGITKKRFTKITDPTIIALLDQIKTRMYQ